MLYDYLTCPICRESLVNSNGGAACKNGHSFDLAKEGYLNLLPVNAKKSADPGDNKQMVNGRKDFLSHGYFEELANFLSHLSADAKCVLDAGCGTGYYGTKIKEFSDCCVCGVDISKFAVRHAAKSGYDCAVVGSVFSMPFKTESFNLAISVFAPICAEELHRALKKGGKLITVCPAEKHLLQLKQVMYGDSVYENPPENAQKPILFKNGEKAFDLIQTHRLTFDKTIETQADIAALLSMTPYLYKTSEDKKQKLLSLSSLVCTFDFYITKYYKI